MNLLSGLFIHQFFPAGISFENLHWHMSQEPSDVASRIHESVARGIIEPEEAENSRLKWAAMLDSDPNAWNGISLALEKIALGRTPTPLRQQAGEGRTSALQVVSRCGVRLPAQHFTEPRPEVRLRYRHTRAGANLGRSSTELT